MIENFTSGPIIRSGRMARIYQLLKKAKIQGFKVIKLDTWLKFSQRDKNLLFTLDQIRKEITPLLGYRDTEIEHRVYKTLVIIDNAMTIKGGK